jgi:hypothetical protein
MAVLAGARRPGHLKHSLHGQSKTFLATHLSLLAGLGIVLVERRLERLERLEPVDRILVLPLGVTSALDQ